jgi:hypothetical protein
MIPEHIYNQFGKTMNLVHNYYWTCECGAMASDTIPNCMACKKARPECDHKQAVRTGNRYTCECGFFHDVSGAV